MGEIRAVIDKKAETKFRVLAMKKFGYGKGSLSKALSKAPEKWIRAYEAGAECTPEVYT